MKRKIYFVAGTMCILAIAVIGLHRPAGATAFQVTTATPAVFVTQQTQFGMFSVNEITGAISFCANNTIVPGASGGQAPIGTCSAASLGTVPPTAGSNNSLSVQGSGGLGTAGAGSAALVYNNQTGQALLCAGSGVVSGGVANVVASCKTVTNLH